MSRFSRAIVFSVSSRWRVLNNATRWKDCSIFSTSFFGFIFFFWFYFDLKFAAAMRLAVANPRIDRSSRKLGGFSGLGAEKQAFHGVSSCFGRRFRPRLLNLVRCPKPPSWNNPLSAFKLFRKLFKARANASSYFPPRRRLPSRLLNHPVPLKDLWSFCVKLNVFAQFSFLINCIIEEEWQFR